MYSTEQYILWLSVLIFFAVMAVIGLIVWLASKQRAFEANHKAFEAKNDDEHFGIFQYLKLASGRLQWLMSKDIADELGKMKNATDADQHEDGKPPS